MITRSDFTDSDVRLDDEAFDHCTFQGCTLRYAGGDLHLTNSTLDGCTVFLDGPAATTVQFLRFLAEECGEDGRKMFQGWFPFASIEP